MEKSTSRMEEKFMKFKIHLQTTNTHDFQVKTPPIILGKGILLC